MRANSRSLSVTIVYPSAITLSGYEKIIATDWLTSPFKTRPQDAVTSAGCSKGRTSSAPSTASSWAESRCDESAAPRDHVDCG